MNVGPELLLIGTVAAVGVLHTMVPDHWVPITLIARQRGWSKGETARASLRAGLGHVLSTLLIALGVWLAGVAVAAHFGHLVDTAASVALVAFGAWIAIAAWRELRGQGWHGHGHAHRFARLGAGEIHGPEVQKIPTDHGELVLSIYESGVPPRFRLTASTLIASGSRRCAPGGSARFFFLQIMGLTGNPSRRFPSRTNSTSSSRWNTGAGRTSLRRGSPRMITLTDTITTMAMRMIT